MADFKWPPAGSGGVTSIDGLTGAVVLVAGTGISITDNSPVANDITIASTSSGDVTIGAFGSTPNANGLSISGSQVLNMQPADGTNPGGVSTLSQTFAGLKTFTTGVTVNVAGSGSVVIDASGTGGGVTLAATSGQAYRTEADGVSQILYGNISGVISTVKPGVFVFNDASQTAMLTLDYTNGFLATKTLTVPQLIDSGLSASTAVYADSNKQLTSSSTTDVELGYVHGVTSAIQTQLNSKQATLTIGNLTDVGTDGIVVTGGTGAVIGSGTSIAQTKADGTHNGYLSSGDWTTFNGKGAGSVTSVGLSVPASSIFGATGTPVTTSGTLGLTVTGTSGGVPYFDTTSTLSSSGLLATKGIVLGGGSGATPTTLATDASTTKVLVSGGSNTAPSWGTVASGAVTTSTFTAPTVQTLTSTGSTTGYAFIVSSANATVGATYTNNGHTYTVADTISAATLLFTTQASAPAASGTLTKSGGTGDATITFSSAVALATYTTPSSPRAPVCLYIRMVGGGGGGAGGGTTNGGGATAGGASYFEAGPLTANGGGFSNGTAAAGGVGGTASRGTSAGVAVNGSDGDGGTTNSALAERIKGGIGGATPFGGAGSGGYNNAGTAAKSNTGSGGGGGGGDTTTSNFGGAGGGAGGYVDVIIPSPSGTYLYAVGGGGTAGSAGTAGQAGGAGAAGLILVEERYQ